MNRKHVVNHIFQDLGSNRQTVERMEEAVLKIDPLRDC